MEFHETINLSSRFSSERPVTASQIDENVERELINHRTLVHPNIVKFREVRGCLRA